MYCNPVHYSTIHRGHQKLQQHQQQQEKIHRKQQHQFTNKQMFRFVYRDRITLNAVFHFEYI